MSEKFPEIMTIGETAEYLRISLSSLYKLAHDGRIPCQKVGRHWRFRKDAIDRWLERSIIVEPRYKTDDRQPIKNI